MKANIIVEQFDNGISLKWSSPEHGNEAAIVALDEERAYTIGKMIWEDIKAVMNSELKNIVVMKIEYAV